MGGKWPAKEYDGYVAPKKYPAGVVLKAWMPFAILSVFVLLWGLPKVKLAINQATTPRSRWCRPTEKCAPASQDGIGPICTTPFRARLPWWRKPTPEGARLRFQLAFGDGQRLLSRRARFRTASGMSPVALMKNILAHAGAHALGHGGHLVHVWALGFVTRYSDSTPCSAWPSRDRLAVSVLRKFLGGSASRSPAATHLQTRSSASLQRITAQQLGIDPILMCAANSAGGVMGKMVDAQSITIATAATEQVGNEGMIFRYVFWHSIALAPSSASSSCFTRTSSRISFRTA